METTGKRQWVRQAFRNEAAAAVPAGFWFHYTRDETEDVFEHPEMLEQNLEGHRNFYRDFRPDFVKLMSDGFFIYPNREFLEAATAEDFSRVRSIGADHPWIEKQVELVKTLTGMFGKETLCFYNIFSPAACFKFGRRSSGKKPETLLGDLIRDGAADASAHAAACAAAQALDVVAGDLAVLARRVIAEGGADGIYLSVQDQDDSAGNGAGNSRGCCRSIGAEDYRRVFAPADKRVLDAANAAAAGEPLNILHICGYAGHRNRLEHYTGYPAQVFNWAVTVEEVSLAEGKKLFGGRCVLGGFDNTTEGVLYRGTEAEIKAETRRILEEAGRTGVVLGADCTVPRGIDLKHLQWVREAAV
jgi:uroporphyrinogen decarboxylase